MLITALRAADVPAALELQSLEGWNQTEPDWRRVLRLDPDGSFAARLDDRLVGTTTTLSFGSELAWIGMVLVHPELRGHGLGRRLMEAALEHLARRGVKSVKLDATPAGKPLYEKLGFVTELIIQRWEGVARPRPGDGATEFLGDHLGGVRALDRDAFGLDRGDVLSTLLEDAHVPALVADSSNAAVPTGFALARPGHRADYIGPLIANDSRSALALLDAMHARLAGTRVYMDVNSGFALPPDALTSRGLVRQRDLYRMWRGAPSALGTSSLVLAIAGPELG
jgi:GNAT superfamily N-acetyltransferase